MIFYCNFVSIVLRELVLPDVKIRLFRIMNFNEISETEQVLYFYFGFNKPLQRIKQLKGVLWKKFSF